MKLSELALIYCTLWKPVWWVSLTFSWFPPDKLSISSKYRVGLQILDFYLNLQSYKKWHSDDFLTSVSFQLEILFLLKIWHFHLHSWVKLERLPCTRRIHYFLSHNCLSFPTSFHETKNTSTAATVVFYSFQISNKRFQWMKEGILSQKFH